MIADLHIHSHYSIATSKDCDPVHLHQWALLKGVDLVGTGDFTHPGWREELQECLEPAEEGLYRLKPECRACAEEGVPPSCKGEVRFVLSSEISSIYKKNERTRKIHNLILVPDLAAAERIAGRLERIGNIRSDGRPILGIDSRNLLELSLDECPDVMFIPAHIWTPHFSLFGANSGFDTIEECFEELSPHLLAMETGLSSDPPMNWRLSALDEYPLVSHSDAHSPRNLAREADLFDTDLSYPAIRAALKDRDPSRFLGTLEFHPEEGKYHYDGHRNCGVRWKPEETLAAGGICPECGKKVTVGVLHRAEVLADRPEGVRPDAARHYESLVPLPEIVGASLDVRPTTKKATRATRALIEALGPELLILRDTPLEEIARHGGPLIAEGVRRVREREVEIFPGFDGEYGRIQVFRPEERDRYRGQANLFDGETSPPRAAAEVGPAPDLRLPPAEVEPPSSRDTSEGPSDSSPQPELNPEQRSGVLEESGPVVLVAGPGTGKTRTLAYRIAHLLRSRNVPPENVLAVTFTNRAAEEMRRRVRSLLPEEIDLAGLTIGTFHRVALDLLRTYRPYDTNAIIDALEARDLMTEVLRDVGSKLRPADALDAISRTKSRGIGPETFEGPEDLSNAYRLYAERLRMFRVWDYDDILLEALRWMEEDEAHLHTIRSRFAHLLVDEFQDVNAVQYRLVQLLAGDGQNTFIIGDPDQAIYGFRGADHRYFRQLTEDFPDARIFVLETNYRSAGIILDAAHAVIRTLPDRIDRTLKPTRAEGSRIRLLRPASELAEGIAVVHEIGRMVGGATMLEAHGQRRGRTLGGTSEERSFSDFAVLFRTGRQADVLEECFLKEGIPYRVVGQRSFLEARPVRDALTFLRFALRPEDDFRLLAALNLKAFHPGQAAMVEIQWQGQKEEAGPSTALRSLLSENALQPEAAGKIRGLLEAGARYRTYIEDERPEQILTRWGEEYAHSDDETFVRLLRIAGRFERASDFLEGLVLYQDGDYERAGGVGVPSEAVTLMTLHAAKGSEFPVVFLCGVEDGLIPYRERGADLHEEQRLFYVGLTRAQDEAILLAARRRRRYGQTLQPELSPFVGEIPEHLIEEEKIDAPRRKKPDARQLSLW